MSLNVTTDNTFKILRRLDNLEVDNIELKQQQEKLSEDVKIIHKEIEKIHTDFTIFKNDMEQLLIGMHTILNKIGNSTMCSDCGGLQESRKCNCGN